MHVNHGRRGREDCPKALALGSARPSVHPSLRSPLDAPQTREFLQLHHL